MGRAEATAFWQEQWGTLRGDGAHRNGSPEGNAALRTSRCRIVGGRSGVRVAPVRPLQLAGVYVDPGGTQGDADSEPTGQVGRSRPRTGNASMPAERTRARNAPCAISSRARSPWKPRVGGRGDPQKCGGPDTDARPHQREHPFHTTEGKAFATERSADVATPQCAGDLVPVLCEVFARADVLEVGERRNSAPPIEAGAPPGQPD